MANGLTLQLEPRLVTGKKVQALRRQGVVPANIYGRGLTSLAVQAPLIEFRRVFRQVARNTVVNAEVAGESAPRPVVLRDVQRNPVTDDVLHIELYQIDVSRPIHSAVAITLSGQSGAVAEGGVLVHSLAEVTLEALPLEMPAQFEVDISGLTQFGHSIHVSDLLFPPNTRVLTDPTAQVVTILAPRLVEEEKKAEGAEGVEAVEGEEAAEGAVPAEGEAEAPADGAPSRAGDRRPRR